MYPHRAYGRNDGLHRPTPYKPDRCAYEVSEPPHYLSSHQCTRKPGHGPDGLFCKQHARVVTRREDRTPA